MNDKKPTNQIKFKRFLFYSNRGNASNRTLSKFHIKSDRNKAKNSDFLDKF